MYPGIFSNIFFSNVKFQYNLENLLNKIGFNISDSFITFKALIKLIVVLAYNGIFKDVITVESTLIFSKLQLVNL